jgi:hypothetical protein
MKYEIHSNLLADVHVVLGCLPVDENGDVRSLAELDDYEVLTSDLGDLAYALHIQRMEEGDVISNAQPSRDPQTYRHKHTGEIIVEVGNSNGVLAHYRWVEALGHFEFLPFA